MLRHSLLMRRFVLSATAFAAMLAGFWSCSPEPGYVGTVTIGSPPLESSALVYIAQSQGFFARQGIDVTVEKYETGAMAHTALLKGEVDVAIPAEYPLVGSALKKEGVSAIASIDKAQYFFLVGRKDRGIENISALRGRRIGVVERTIAEFYLRRLLTLNGIDKSQVTVTNISYQQSGDAIVEGTVDAIVSRPPYLAPVMERLGSNGINWPVHSSQALYAILTARHDWISENLELVERLLKSLAAAEEFAVRHPTEAKSIVQKELKLDAFYTETIWAQNQFGLSLDQSLIVAMEDEARWMIGNNLTGEQAVPDFLDFVSEDTLKKIKPESVNIIR